MIYLCYIMGLMINEMLYSDRHPSYRYFIDWDRRITYPSHRGTRDTGDMPWWPIPEPEHQDQFSVSDVIVDLKGNHYLKPKLDSYPADIKNMISHITYFIIIKKKCIASGQVIMNTMCGVCLCLCGVCLCVCVLCGVWCGCMSFGQMQYIKEVSSYCI